jgi:hypothetical protein
VEENNAGKAAAALMAQLSLKTKVLRDGAWSEQEAEVLVPGMPFSCAILSRRTAMYLPFINAGGVFRTVRKRYTFLSKRLERMSTQSV